MKRKKKEKNICICIYNDRNSLEWGRSIPPPPILASFRNLLFCISVCMRMCMCMYMYVCVLLFITVYVYMYE